MGWRSIDQSPPSVRPPLLNRPDIHTEMAYSYMWLATYKYPFLPESIPSGESQTAQPQAFVSVLIWNQELRGCVLGMYLLWLATLIKSPPSQFFCLGSCQSVHSIIFADHPLLEFCEGHRVYHGDTDSPSPSGTNSRIIKDPSAWEMQGLVSDLHEFSGFTDWSSWKINTYQLP